MNAQKQRTSIDIIEHIADIYDELEVLPNIREHQARVAGIILVCKAHWRGPAINWDDAVAAALVHDLGNIVKAKLDDPLSQKILGPEECERIEHWKEVKQRISIQYGDDEYAVTRALCHALGVSERIIDIALTSTFRYNSTLVTEGDWEKKLAGYSDRITGPFGVLTLDGRIAEGATRYGHQRYAPEERPPIVQAAYDLQKQVQEQVTIPLDSITENSVQPHVQRFLRRD